MRPVRLALLLTIFCATLVCSSALAADTPKEGGALPAFTLPAPSAKDCGYLGVPKGKPFKLKDVQAKIVSYNFV